MIPAERLALRVFFDSSVVIAGSASRSGASYVLLQLAGLGLIDGRISSQVREESLRNTARKLPAALPALSLLLREVLTEGAAQHPDIGDAWKLADPKDRPILAAALAQECRYLVTLNEKDFWPPVDRILVLRPGELLRRLRELISTAELE